MVTSMVPAQSPDLRSGSVITMKSIYCTNTLIWYIISQRTPMHFYCISDLNEMFTNMLTCAAKAEHLSVDMYENDVYSVPCNDPLSSTASDVIIALMNDNDAMHHISITAWMHVALCILIEFGLYEYCVNELTMGSMWSNVFRFFF